MSSDKKKIHSKLLRLPVQLYSVYAIRKAMQILPILAVTLTRRQAQFRAARRVYFEFWPEDERSWHLMNVLRAQNAALYLADLQARSVVTSRRSVEYLRAQSLDEVRAAESAFLAKPGETNVYVLDGIFQISDVMSMTIAALETRLDMRAELAARMVSSKFMLKDIEQLNPRIAAKHFIRAPLWPRKMPQELKRLWQDFQMATQNLQAGFEFWLTWYEQRLAGPFVEQAVWEKQLFVPDEIEAHGTLAVNEYLAGESPSWVALEVDNFVESNDDGSWLVPDTHEASENPHSSVSDKENTLESCGLDEWLVELMDWLDELVELIVHEIRPDEVLAIAAVDSLKSTRDALEVGTDAQVQALQQLLQQLRNTASAALPQVLRQINIGEEIQSLLVERIEAILAAMGAATSRTAQAARLMTH